MRTSGGVACTKKPCGPLLDTKGVRVDSLDFGTIFLHETIGTALLLLLGTGVVANVALAKTKGFDGGFLLVNFGWGIGVFAGVYAAYKSGAHLNPAVTLGLLASGADLSAGQIVAYLLAQFLGAFIGAVLCWLAYRKHFDDPDSDPDAKLAVFSTSPGIASPFWNVMTEVIGTFVLVFVVIAFGKTPSGLGPLAVALLVVGIGASLGGPTGYAINPARDLSPRIAHAVLPIRNKGGSNWGYSWVPVVGPIIGGVLAGIVANLVDYV
ncbi:glycerol uptake facilitator protein [Knoellia remsis]|uniref:Glycerol uptake facilitator protein n=1 Tax=Knoellia remsis TaxID=407159 RepID=A0A2T0UXZ6_9MICO|nr:glycerol uptake facilitator protein [Knoellia remsis]